MHNILSNAGYEISILFMLIVDMLLVLKLNATNTLSKNNKWIISMFIICFCCAASDALCVAFGNVHNRALIFVLNAVFVVTFTLVGLDLFINNEKQCGSIIYKNKLLRAITLLPALTLFGLIFCSYWNGLVFYVDENYHYSRGELYNLFFIGLGNIYIELTLILSMLRLIREKNKDRRKLLLRSFYYALPIMVGSCVQIYVPYIPCFNMGLTMTMILFFVNGQEFLIKDMVKQNEKERDLLAVLCADYSAVYYVDLLNNHCEIVKNNERSHNLNELCVECNYYDMVQTYYDKYVNKEKSPDFLEKLDVEYIKKALENEDRYPYRYIALPNENGQMYFEMQAVKMDVGEDEFKVVLGFRGIDDIINDEIEQNHKLEKALNVATISNEIIYAISTIYFVMFRVDIDEDYFEQLKNDDDDLIKLTSNNGKASEMFNDAVERLVAPDYREKMHRFTDISTLSDRLYYRIYVSYEYITANGEWHLARFITKKRDERGRALSAVFVTMDISAQKNIELSYQKRVKELLEEYKRADIAKTSFLRHMSHDIRTPINGIMGMLDIADNVPDDVEKQTEYRNKIRLASSYLLELVNNVLDMSKLESGQIKLSSVPFDLIQILKDSNSVIGMQAKSRGIEMDSGDCVFKHTKFIGSPVHIKQILLNISSNAVKYSHSGGRIELSSKEIWSDDDYAYYEFKCADNGIGMSEEFQKHIFEPFSQEKNDARTMYNGTGLGLAIVKELVELMDGKISYSSKEGEGTTFIIGLKLAIDKQATEIVKADNETATLDNFKILLVEDNELNMEIAKYYLESSGAEVDGVWNGEEAVEAFEKSEQGSYNAILMDIMMPVMDGIEAAKRIRALDRADAKQIPIFAMTANAFTDDIERSKEVGMNEHISKPIEMDKLIKLLNKYIK